MWGLVRTPVSLAVDALRGLAALPKLELSLRRLAAADGPLDQLADVSETLRRLAGFDETLRQLGALEDTLDRIAMVGVSLERLAAVTDSLERLAVTSEGLGELPVIVSELHITVQQLGASMQPIGRIAGRIPGSGSRAERRVRTEQG
jgi:hypothetical protein